MRMRGVVLQGTGDRDGWWRTVKGLTSPHYQGKFDIDRLIQYIMSYINKIATTHIIHHKHKNL